jgi:hypothetical protein
MSAAASTLEAMSQHWSPKSQVIGTATPGRWFMVDEGARIAILQQLQIGPKKETMYRSVTFAERSEERALIGYFPHLQMAAEITWREYLKARQR